MNLWGIDRARGAIKRLAQAQIVRFGAVGAATTLLDFVLFSALAVGLRLHPAPANIISYGCGIIASFYLNRAWTFRIRDSRASLSRHALRFAASNLAGPALSTVLVAGLSLAVPALVAKLVSLPIVFAWNYGLARLWVFRRH